MAITLRRAFGLAAIDLAAASRAALEAPIDGDAELWLGSALEEATLLGAFERANGVPPLRRGSGGPRVHVGLGTSWVALLLPRVDALVDCDEARIVNRYVRPLLRALTRVGAPAHYFGRDWISVKHRPAAWVGFAHDAASGRAVVEAFIARETRFADGARASFLGKDPGTLAEIIGSPVSEDRLADAIARAFADAYARAVVDGGPPAIPRHVIEEETESGDPPWAATLDEAIGLVGAGPDARGHFRVGGELLASRDAIAALEGTLPGTADEDVGALVDTTFGAPHVALDGVRSLTSLRDVILAARRAADGAAR